MTFPVSNVFKDFETDMEFRYDCSVPFTALDHRNVSKNKMKKFPYCDFTFAKMKS